MQRYIAFLRAINVGGRTVRMERLRGLFEELGHANVATFIASGNVIFESPAGSADALERGIEEHLREALGYPVDTFIRTAAELAAIVEHHPFPADGLSAPGSSLYVSLMHKAPTAEARKKVLALRTPADEFHLHERELYWFCRTKISDSPVFSGGTLEKIVGMPATMRNITTLRKLAAKYPAMAATQ